MHSLCANLACSLRLDTQALTLSLWCNSTFVGSPRTPRALQGTGGLRAKSSGPLCWGLGRKYKLGSFMMPGFDSHPEQ